MPRGQGSVLNVYPGGCPCARAPSRTASSHLLTSSHLLSSSNMFVHILRRSRTSCATSSSHLLSSSLTFSHLLRRSRTSCATLSSHLLSPSLTFSNVRLYSQTLEDELRDLNAEYKHVARTLQDPRAASDAGGAGALAGDAGLREIVLRMEHKSAQAR